MDLELQYIHPMSIFYVLMGALLDYLILVLRGIANMSAPIYEHYRCSPSRRQSKSFWSLNKLQLESEPSQLLEQLEQENGGNMLLSTSPPQPLAAMYSLQLMADVVNQVQTVLNQCAATSQKSPNATMTGIELELEAFNQCREPTFCYFFIPSQMCSTDEFGSSHRSNDSNNNAEELLRHCPLTAKSYCNLKRSISECSDDSFICFEDDSRDEAAKSDEEDDPDDFPTANCLSTANSFCDLKRSISECSDDSFICFEDDSNDKAGKSDEEDDPDDFQMAKECEAGTALEKKVRFDLKPQIHVMHTWNFAYRAARKGEWQCHARDSARFHQRIARVAAILNPIMSSNHRQKVYKDRFLNIT